MGPAPSQALAATLLAGLCLAGLTLALTAGARNMAARSEPRLAAPDRPRRILVTANVMPALAALAPGTGRVVATTWLGLSDMAFADLDRIFPQAKEIPLLATSGLPDPEAVLLARPDLVLGWRGQRGRLAAPGLPPFAALTDGGSRADEEALWLSLGRVLGEEAHAERLARSGAARLAAVRAHVPRGKPVRVLVLLSNPRETWIGPRRLPLTRRLAWAGAENVAPTEQAPAVNLEEIARIDPDVLLLASGAGPFGPDDLLADPRWRMLRAVRACRVFPLPRFPTFATPIYDAPLVAWLIDTLHPGHGPRLAPAALREAYRDAFDVELSAGEAERLLPDGATGFCRRSL